MTKQLMIYENAVPISPEEHRNISVRQGTSFGFAAALNSVPLVVAEFEKASAEYPIIFAGVALPLNLRRGAFGYIFCP